MPGERRRKPIKIGVRRSGGPPPGYRWTVEIVSQSFEEAMSFLNEEQYQHLAQQVRELALQDDPTHSQTIDIRPIEDFHEIRDKGGILQRINCRVFYFVRKESKTIVVIGTIKKENNGPTPMGDKIRMRRRMRQYLESFE